jgi:hypothetical protein
MTGYSTGITAPRLHGFTVPPAVIAAVLSSRTT